ncbi:MAG: hypothetical protein IJT49_00260 [Clostridia bacterium]|nr:hypothetical protein [Clostridia bacterium]
MKKIVAVFLSVVFVISVLSSVTFYAAGEDPDTYFYDTTGTTATGMGYWLWLDSGDYIADQTDIKIRFTTPNAFSGFMMNCDSGNPTMTIRLLKKSGAILEEISQLIGGGWNTINFSKAYPAGTYSIQILAAHPHFILRGTAANAAMPVTVTGGVYNYGGTYPNGAPMIKLIGAIPPEVVEESPDIWFYKEGTVVAQNPAWGIGPYVKDSYADSSAVGYVNTSFFAPSGFSAISFMYQTYGAVNMDAYLLDRDGNVLEYFNVNVNNGELSAFMHSFSKTYERGSYILQIVDAGIASGGFFWMMKGQANETVDVTVGGNFANNTGIHDAPAIILIGDEPAVREGGYSLYKQVGPATIGWWMWPKNYQNDNEMNITFSTPNSFYGFQMESHASGSMIAMVKLFDSGNNQLGPTIQTGMAEGKKIINFPELYPAGTYTIKIIHESANDQYFVLRAGEKDNGVNVTVSGIPADAINTANVLTNPAPAIKLLGPAVDPDVWFCCGLPYTLGWQIGPGINSSVANGNINFTFTSESAFRGFKMACYADAASPAVIQTKLLDEDGNILETLANQTISGDHVNLAQGFADVNFSKAYGKGTYTVQMSIVGGSYFILASSREYYDAVCKITGNNITSDSSLGGPGIMLYGAAAPREFGVTDNGKLNIVIDGGTGYNKASPGDEIDVKIKLLNLDSLSSLKMTLSYGEKLNVTTLNGKPQVTFDICEHNPSVLTAVSEAQLDESKRELILNWMALEDEVNYANDYAAGEDAVFATVRFKVADNAENGSFIPIKAKIETEDVFKADQTWETVAYKLINGCVDVIDHLHDLSVRYDSEYHWYECSGCNNHFSKEAHTGAWVYDQAQGTRTRTCTVCGYQTTEPETVLRFNTVSLSLKENFQMNFKADKSVLDEAGYTALRAEFIIGEDKIDVTPAVNNGKYEFSFSNIAPDKMTDVIQATLYATYAGTEYQSSTLSYNIREYCDTNLDKTADCVSANRKKLRTLIADTLNYGAAAQSYTGHNTAAPANDNIGNIGTQTVPEMTGYSEVKNNLDNDLRQIRWRAISLRLEDSITMRFGFELAGVNGTDGITVKITDKMPDEAGANVLAEINSFTTSGGYYRADFSGLNAAEMRKIIYVTAYRGTTQISKTLQYSVESYAFSKKDDAMVGDLVKAMMRYGDSAKAYNDMLVNGIDLNEEVALH